MGLNLDASPEELKLFLEEAEEHMQTLEDDLVRLEKEADNEELLQEIFRASHTLKGSSATIGHKRMAELTHAMENVLDKLRKNQLTVNSSIVDVLFECLDHLRVLKEEIVNDEESDIDLTGILDKLANVSNFEGGTLAAQTAVSTAPAVETRQNVPEIDFSYDEKTHLDKGIKEGQTALVISTKFDVEPEMLAVRCFVTLMAIREWGDVVKSIPSAEDIEKEQVGSELTVVLLTKETPENIEKLLKDLPNLTEPSVRKLDLSDEMAATNMSGAEKPGAQQEQEKPKSRQSKDVADRAAGLKKSSNRTVRVDVDLLDSLMNLVGELVIDRTRLFQIYGELENNYDMDEISQELGRTSVHIGRVSTQLQELIMKARMLPVESLFNKFPRMVRDLSHKAGKEVNFVMTGQETELDRSIIEEIGDPLIHLLRNALDHGIEPPGERVAAGKPPVGNLWLQAAHEENHIIISIRDDGRGIDPEVVRKSAVKKNLLTEEQAKRLTDKEAINLIFASGLSTAQKVTDVSGRGVGMDVVRTNIERINGAIEINTAVGKGTEFKIKLPLTLAIIRALLVSLNKHVYAIPLSSVIETIRMRSNQVEYVNNREVIVVRGKVLPLIRLEKVFNIKGGAKDKDKLFVVVVNLAGTQVGIVVDSLVGEQEIVIKSLGKYIGDVPGISGAAILGDGNVALIVDVPNLLKKAAS
ncbi:CheA signal transduction histidine kinase [Thermincola ferriacetica]|uniref:Chemotaxis protein CheA n=1 Tax=Thermincola ferriacetica TaxID=281456 RepID=A0A0L6W0T9_9FIRM|nr:chemotaxis protein CheA [Thermincola ferriacetica]KNZ69197.1 CheA signal transduction histidine kinase [Thermincola ferriacetica]